MKITSFSQNDIIAAATILLLYLACGHILAYLAKDELKDGRKWFKVLIISGIIAGISFIFIGEKSIGISCLGIALGSSVSYYGKG